jgi:hypothetical protein
MHKRKVEKRKVESDRGVKEEGKEEVRNQTDEPIC